MNQTVHTRGQKPGKEVIKMSKITEISDWDEAISEWNEEIKRRCREMGLEPSEVIFTVTREDVIKAVVPLLARSLLSLLPEDFKRLMTMDIPLILQERLERIYQQIALRLKEKYSIEHPYS